jgi:hypothetical protein
MQENDTNIIVGTDRVKAFIGNLVLWVKYLDGKISGIFYPLKYFFFWKKTVEISDTGTDQFIKDHLENQHSRSFILQKQ